MATLIQRKSKNGQSEDYIEWEELIAGNPHQLRVKSRSKVSRCEDSSAIFAIEDHLKRNAQALLDLIMDSGCSYHMTPRYIPELKRNLISLGTLEKEGYTVKMQSGKIKSCAGLAQKTRTYQRGGTTGAGKASSVWQGESRFKHEAFGKFEEWKQLVENQTGRTVKKLRTDNGLEFCNRESPSTAIEKKTLMEMWSGHPSDYGMLRIFGCVAYPHDKQGKLELRAIKCVLLGYPEGVKGYKLYRLDGESPKIVTSRNVVFNESVMYKETLKDSGASDKSVEELQVEVELQRLNNHTHEEDQEDGNDEDAGDQETNQPPDLTDYQLTRDREARTRTKPLRFQDEIEAVACEDSSKWKAAMEEEMDSLRKNKTWELVELGKSWYLNSMKYFPRYGSSTQSLGFILGNLTGGMHVKIMSFGQQIDVKDGIFYMVNLEEVIYIMESNHRDITQGNKAEIGSAKSLLKKEFDMKELGEAKKILGMEIVRDRSRKILRVSQSGGQNIVYAGGSFITEAEYMDTYGGCVGSYFAKGDSWMRTKHINVRYHFIREVLEAKTVKVLKVGTEHNAADALTKVVPGRKLQHCLELLKVGVG
ncbi:retrotransposon protein, putative, ty1-copia subclass [Tanacetum coccineum]